MFTFLDTPAKFIGLLLLFGWCTIWCGYELSRPQNGRQRVSNVLHLVMAVVMLLMVAGPTWRAMTAVVPDVWLAAGFGVATGWFVYLAVAAFAGGDRSGGWHGVGHAAMFGAMTWHLSAMAAMSSAMNAGGGMDMGGMGGMGGPLDMDAWVTAQSRAGGTLWVFALIGLPFVAYLLSSSLYALWAAVRPAPAVVADDCHAPGQAATPHAASAGHAPASTGGASVALAPAPAEALAYSCHEVRPQGSPRYRLAHTADFAMNFGMFWMSTGLLVPILPFLAALAF